MVLNPSITYDPQDTNNNKSIKYLSNQNKQGIDCNTRGTTSSPTSIGLLLEASKKIGVQSPQSCSILPSRRGLIAWVPLDPYLLYVPTSQGQPLVL